MDNTVNRFEEAQDNFLAMHDYFICPNDEVALTEARKIYYSIRGTIREALTLAQSLKDGPIELISDAEMSLCEKLDAGMRSDGVIINAEQCLLLWNILATKSTHTGGRE